MSFPNQGPVSGSPRATPAAGQTAIDCTNRSEAVSGLFIGAATLDLQYLVDGLPAQNIKKPSTDLAVSAGGPAANAAALFARLGGRAHVVAAVGRHPMGRLIKEDLAQDGVELIDLMEGDALPRISSIFVTAADGDRTAVTAPRTTPALNFVPLDGLDPKSFDVLLVDGMLQQAAIPLCQAARQAGIPVVFDSGSWKEGLEDVLAHVSHAIVGETFRMPGAPTPEAVLVQLQALGVPYVAMTQGGDPIRTLSVDGYKDVPVKPVETVVDTLGAGDFFHGAVAFALARGAGFEEALTEGSLVVADRVQVFGARRWLRHFAPDAVLPETVRAAAGGRGR